MLRQTIRQAIKKPLFVELIFSVLYTGCIAFIPYLNKLLFDGIEENGASALFRLIPIYFLTIVGSAIFQNISQVKEWEVDKCFTIRMKDKIFSSIFRRNPVDFYSEKEGEYLSKVNNNVNALMEEYVEAIVDMIKAAIQIIIYAMILFFLVDYRIAIVILGTSLLSVEIPRLTADRIAKKRKKYMDRLGLYTDRLSDYFLGYRGLDIPSRENIIRHHKGELLETEEFKFVWGKFKTLTNVINGFVMDIISFSAFIIVGLLYVRGEITIGTGIATFGYIESFIYPIKYILNDMNSIHSSRELMKEMEELIEVQGETTEVSEEIGEEIREIRLEGIMIKRGDFCLKNFNYVFEMGKKYGIIGESGTGKTTILSVLAGEVIPDKGRVLVNGKDMTGKMDRVASAYCFFLSQYPHLFRMPYYENVTNFGTYGGEKLAKLERELPSKFVEALKKTESTELSGGEKQVLGLLKGRISGKKVFLLDEVFSAIDKGSTENIKAFIDKEKGEAGIQIEVTHDLTEENLKRFDEVVRL